MFSYCCCSDAKSFLLFVTPWTAACQASLSFTIFRSWLKLMSIELVMPSNHLILCHPLLLPSIFPGIRVFLNELTLHIRRPKHCGFSYSISLPTNVQGSRQSLTTDWFDFLEVQETLKSLLQHHSVKTSILCCSAFFMVQLPHLYVTTGKTIALNIWTFVGKVMSMLFDMLSRFVIAFLPRSKCLLTSWTHHLQWFRSLPK